MNGSWCTKVVLVAVIATTATGTGPVAQTGGGPERGNRPPKPPLELALDADKDGTIDADEIANAVQALKTLDKNGDGMLTPDEYRPPRPDRQGGPGGEGAATGEPRSGEAKK